MESGKIKTGLNTGLWRVMDGFSRDVSAIPTMKSLDKKQLKKWLIYAAFESIETIYLRHLRQMVQKVVQSEINRIFFDL